MSEEQEQTPKGKASRTEVAARVDEVLRIRLDSAQFHDVVEYAKEKGWNVSLRQLARYIRKADELLVRLQGLYPSDKELAEQRERVHEEKPAPLSREEMLQIARQAACEARAVEPDPNGFTMTPPRE